jgi:hypothetical protein
MQTFSGRFHAERTTTTLKKKEKYCLKQLKLEHWEETGYDIWDKFWDTIGRGESRYIVLYDNDQPSEIFFIGYSVD